MKKRVAVGSNKMHNKLGRRFDEALRFASKKHGRQTRKGTDVLTSPICWVSRHSYSKPAETKIWPLPRSYTT